MTPTLQNHATPSADVLFQEVGGEAVLLSLASEQYFGLNPVGTRIWQLLGRDSSLQAAFDVLCGEWEIEPARLQDDLLSLVAQLADAGLVRVV